LKLNPDSSKKLMTMQKWEKLLTKETYRFLNLESKLTAKSKTGIIYTEKQKRLINLKQKFFTKKY